MGPSAAPEPARSQRARWPRRWGRRAPCCGRASRRPPARPPSSSGTRRRRWGSPQASPSCRAAVAKVEAAQAELEAAPPPARAPRARRPPALAPSASPPPGAGRSEAHPRRTAPRLRGGRRGGAALPAEGAGEGRMVAGGRRGVRRRSASGPRVGGARPADGRWSPDRRPRFFL